MERTLGLVLLEFLGHLGFGLSLFEAFRFFLGEKKGAFGSFSTWVTRGLKFFLGVLREEGIKLHSRCRPN